MRMIKDLKRSRVGMTGRRRRVLHSCQTTNINKVLQSLTNNTETVVSLIKSDSKMLKIPLAQTNGQAVWQRVESHFKTARAFKVSPRKTQNELFNCKIIAIIFFEGRLLISQTIRNQSMWLISFERWELPILTGRRVFLNLTFLPLTICDINSNLVVKFSTRVANFCVAVQFWKWRNARILF